MEPGTWTHLRQQQHWSHVPVLEWWRYTKLLLIMLKTKTIMKQKIEKIIQYEWRARAVSFMAPGILYNRPQKYATTKDSVLRIRDPETRILAAGPQREAAEFGSGFGFHFQFCTGGQRSGNELLNAKTGQLCHGVL